MKILADLEEVLRRNAEFLGENNEIIKTKVAQAAMNMRADFLKSLLQKESLKKVFFTEVGDLLVFDKMKFVWTLESREFLPSSYTSYKNKIGLIDGRNNFIAQSRDVALVWPYKDCVLKGGQTKDEDKRQEVFYNETLAHTEITQLLAPKVLGKAKRYSLGGGGGRN